MTQAQMNALDTAHRILAEHFDGAILSVNCENEDTSSSNHIRVPAGDAFQALGLLKAAEHQLLLHGQTTVVGNHTDSYK
jgi:hypothetical protein